MTSPVLSVEAIQAIPDPLIRAHEAQRLTDYAETRANTGRDLRDAGIREARKAGVRPGDIAAGVGVSLATVFAVTRGLSGVRVKG